MSEFIDLSAEAAIEQARALIRPIKEITINNSLHQFAALMRSGNYTQDQGEIVARKLEIADEKIHGLREAIRLLRNCHD